MKVNGYPLLIPLTVTDIFFTAMYAIIKDRNKQYRVREGAEILVDYMSDRDEGEAIEFDDVLFFSDDEDVKVGQPDIDGMSVKGTVAGTEKGEKKVILKFKRRSRYRRTIGHRQKYTKIRVDSIENGS